MAAEPVVGVAEGIRAVADAETVTELRGLLPAGPERSPSWGDPGQDPPKTRG